MARDLITAEQYRPACLPDPGFLDDIVARSQVRPTARTCPSGTVFPVRGLGVARSAGPAVRTDRAGLLDDVFLARVRPACPVTSNARCVRRCLRDQRAVCGAGFLDDTEMLMGRGGLPGPLGLLDDTFRVKWYLSSVFCGTWWG